MTVNEGNKDPGDEYLRRFRGVEPPGGLRARVLGTALPTARPSSRDRWLLGVAALVLVLLAVVNVHLEDRVRALTGDEALRRGAPAKGDRGRPELVEPFRSLFRSRLAARRPPRVGEQSWLKLRAEIERIEG